MRSPPPSPGLIFGLLERYAAFFIAWVFGLVLGSGRYSAPGVLLASVARQTDCNLSRAFLPRVTFSRMSEALAVQMKGLGFSLWSSR